MNGLFRMYGIYIIMVVALAGLAVVLFGLNSPIQLSGGSNSLLSTCSPDDPTCIPGYGSPSIGGSTGSKTKTPTNNIGGTTGTGSSGSISTTATKTKAAANYETTAFSGTCDTVCHVTSCAELQSIKDDCDAGTCSGTYVLDNNINCAGFNYNNDGKGFMPIGRNDPYFTGIFDGKGFSITGLYINRPDNTYATGLFGYTSGATIKNVGLINVEITGGPDVGGLIGASEGDTVSNSYVESGSVNGNGDACGGLIGDANGGIIDDCYIASVNVNSGGSGVGGLVGHTSMSAVIT
ncbi:MAG: hypothetical protein NTY68_00250, partial [Candidatus Micrarchaeota archaeon]|nr:hypothetical protein [Candidatus Micrarchaeota archaeon]